MVNLLLVKFAMLQFVKKALYLSVYLFSTKVLIGDTMFLFPTGNSQLTWSSEPCKGLAVLQHKGSE